MKGVIEKLILGIGPVLVLNCLFIWAPRCTVIGFLLLLESSHVMTLHYEGEKSSNGVSIEVILRDFIILAKYFETFQAFEKICILILVIGSGW